MNETGSHDSHLTSNSDNTRQPSRQDSTSPATSRRNLRIAFPRATSRTDWHSGYDNDTVNSTARQHAAIETRGSVDDALDSTDPAVLELTWRERMKHFTWTWFTVNMAGGGVANVLREVPFRFHGLYTIGVVIFLFDLVFFSLIILGTWLRYHYHPAAFKASFLHPTESLFIPAVMISIATKLINIAEYGLVDGKTGLWLIKTMIVLFWVYASGAVLFSVGIYLMIWSTQTFTVQTMTPLWIFPAYPLLLVGPFASILTAVTAPNEEIASDFLAIIVGGVVVQGMGFLLALTMHATYIYRLMTQKLPQTGSRPGMFISVGPSGFTSTALIGLAGNLPKVVGATFMGEEGYIAARITKIMGYWAGIWLWGLTLIFFFIAVGAHLAILHEFRRIPFAMTWNSFVFPNSALTTATFSVASALDNQPLRIVGCCLTIILIIMWLFVLLLNFRAVIKKQILWPQRQEDRDSENSGGRAHALERDGVRRRHHMFKDRRLDSSYSAEPIFSDPEVGRGGRAG